MGQRIDIRVLPDLNAVHLCPRGEFSIDYALTWGPALDADPACKPGMHQVVDFSALAPGSPSRAEIDLLVQALRRRNPADSPFLVAYVAPTDLKFGMTRMFELMCDTEMPRGRGVFRTLDEALAWVAAGGVACA